MSNYVDRREYVFVAELLAFIHDLGKVNDPYGKEYSFRTHRSTLRKEMCLSKKKEDPRLVENYKSFAERMKLHWGHIYNKKLYFGVKKESPIGESALRHHYRYPGPSNVLEHIIAQADNMDSREDRTYAPRVYTNYGAMTKYVCNSFGYTDFEQINQLQIKNHQSEDILDITERKIHGKIADKDRCEGCEEGCSKDFKDNVGKECDQNFQKNFRRLFYKEFSELFGKEDQDNPNFLENLIEKRKDIFEIAKKYLSHAPAMSQSPDHDTSVYDHDFGTAAISKAIINSLLLGKDEQNNFKAFVMDYSRNKKIKHKKYSYYLCAVNVSDSLEKTQLENILKSFTCDSINTELDLKKDNIPTIFTYNGSADSFSHYFILKSEKDVKVDSLRKKVSSVINEKRKDVTVVRLIKKFNEKKDKKTINWFNIFKSGGRGTKTNLLDCLIGIPNVLAVQFPGRDFRTKVHRIPDFLGREIKLKKVLEEVKKYIEEELALGNCIYEDVNGIYFLIPELKRIQHAEINKEKIRKEIMKKFNSELLDGLILPRISYRPCCIRNNSINPGAAIVELKKDFESNLKRKLPPYNLNKLDTIPDWKQEWAGAKEICQICGKRPVVNEGHKKYANEKACLWCLDSRNFKFDDKDIVQSVENATFINQVMDENHKVALITGDLGLYDLWLSGDYVGTNVNIFNQNNEVFSSKPHSPARLSRLVYSINQYFQQVVNELNDKKELKAYKAKIKGIGETSPLIGYYSVPYANLTYEDVKSIFSDKSRWQHYKKLLSANGKNELKLYVYQSNDDQFEAEIVSGIPKFYYKDDDQIQISDSDIKKIVQVIFKKAGKMTPEKDESKSLAIDLNKVDISEYTKIREVYRVADEFMMLVPANRVGDVVKIFDEYFKTHMGKAQGRISLNIGTVFFDHKYPLYLIFEGGKRMLAEFREIIVGPTNSPSSYDLILRRSSDLGDEKYRAAGYKAYVDEINLIDENIINTTIEFEDGPFKGQQLPIRYPGKIQIYKTLKRVADLKNGEKQEAKLFTEDIWFTKGLVFSDDSTVQLKSWVDVVKNQSNEKRTQETEKVLIKKDDHLLFAPNMFDFQLVNSTESRVQIQVEEDEEGKNYQKRVNPNCTNYRTRPILLHDFLSLKKKADELKDVPLSSLHKLQEMLIQYAKRFYLSEKPTDFFNDFSETLIVNIGDLQKHKDTLLKMIENGIFFDFMELKTSHQIYDWQENLELKEGTTDEREN